ncbi:MAG: NPCBM/NEW2 domain-containing protein [Planctomycetes bacterium]|nr:NPCBM/NEW2 domain-containing protein [Planctomycetota bacterium]MBL7041545.1 NPCBM/NEW2 domain-containing protein [Pirellulaceae bacterium]
MNEHSPQSRGDGAGTTVAVVFVVVVIVLFALMLLGAVFVFLRGAPVGMTARTSFRNSVTTVSDVPVETTEDIDEAGLEQPAEGDVDRTTKMTDEAPEVEPSKPDAVVEDPERTSTPKADPDSKPSDSPPSGVTGKPDTTPPGDEDTPAKKNDLSLMTPSERIGLKTGDGGAPRSVAFSGQKCESVIWVQPEEDEGVAQVGYMLDGKFATLRGTAGISDTVDDAGARDQKPSAVFRIYGDSNLLWESETLTGFGSAEQFEVQVKGIEVLALVAESSSSSEVSRLAWGDVELKATSE